MKMCSQKCHKINNQIDRVVWPLENKNGVGEVDMHGAGHELEILFWIDTYNRSVTDVAAIATSIKSKFNRNASKKNWGDVSWSYTYGQGCIGLVAYVRHDCKVIPSSYNERAFRISENYTWYDPTIQKIIL